MDTCQLPRVAPDVVGHPLDCPVFPPIDSGGGTSGVVKDRLAPKLDLLFQRVREGLLRLSTAQSMADELAVQAHRQRETATAVRALSLVAVVATQAGDLHGARRAIETARVQRRDGRYGLVETSLRVMDARVRARCGDVLGAIRGLVEVLTETRAADNLPWRVLAARDLVLNCAAAQRTDLAEQALLWAYAQCRQREDWSRFRSVFGAVELDLALKKAAKAHSFSCGQVVGQGVVAIDGANDFDVALHKCQSLLSSYLELHGDQLEPALPGPELGCLQVRGLKLRLALLAGRAGATDLAHKAIRQALDLDDITVVPGLALELSIAHQACGSGIKLVPLFRQALLKWDDEAGPSAEAATLCYCLHKALLDAGQIAAALDAYRRYAQMTCDASQGVAGGTPWLPQLLKTESDTRRDRLPNSADRGMPGYLRLALGAIERDFLRSDLTVERIASEVRVSTRTLRSAFAQHLHKSPLAYLRDYRLDRAKELLASRGPQSVREVAQACGWPHAGRFSKEFRLKFGHSPLEVLAANPGASRTRAPWFGVMGRRASKVLCADGYRRA